MRRHVLLTLAAALALGFTASAARAACDFEHPSKAKQIKSNMVQAFVSCNNPGGNSSGGHTTEGGVPSCAPPETYCQASGNCPGTGWEWGDGTSSASPSSSAQVQFKSGPNKVIGPLNPPGAQDLAVTLKLKGIVDGGGLVGPSPGTLATVARATFNDRGDDGREGSTCAGGTNDAAPCADDSECPGGVCGFDESGTVIDFPAGFNFTLGSPSPGKVVFKTSANALLNGIGQPGLPGCSNIEVVSVTITDENGDTFANLGTYLKDVIVP